MKDSKIEWTHHTANLWWGCTHVHAGCDNCYAETLSKRWGNEVWGNDKPRKEIKKVWSDLEKFQKMAAGAGEIHRVFVGSMMDIFEKPMPLIDSKGELYKCIKTDILRMRLFENISLGYYPNLMFLLLTKRPSNINKYIPESWKENPPANVMFGTSVVNQETADTLIPQLLQVKGKRFLSCEPLLGPISFERYGCYEILESTDGSPNQQSRFSCYIHWVIVGGESGHGARPMNPKWVINIRNQCNISNVPFLFKQWGEWVSEFHHAVNHEKNYKHSTEFVKMVTIEGIPDYEGEYMLQIGKKTAGNILDGKQYLEFPKC